MVTKNELNTNTVVLQYQHLGNNCLLVFGSENIGAAKAILVAPEAVNSGAEARAAEARAVEARAAEARVAEARAEAEVRAAEARAEAEVRAAEARAAKAAATRQRTKQETADLLAEQEAEQIAKRAAATARRELNRAKSELGSIKEQIETIQNESQENPVGEDSELFEMIITLTNTGRTVCMNARAAQREQAALNAGHVVGASSSSNNAHAFTAFAHAIRANRSGGSGAAATLLGGGGAASGGGGGGGGSNLNFNTIRTTIQEINFKLSKYEEQKILRTNLKTNIEGKIAELKAIRNELELSLRSKRNRPRKTRKRNQRRRKTRKV
jgi:chromosome segregation ATPase